MRDSPRVNYDDIAHLYDGQPFRGRAVDPQLSAFVDQRKSPDLPSILDIGCGTGNQLVANRSLAPGASLVGLDRSLGMLRQAQPKASDIGWVRGDATMLPFRPQSFDFVGCQFAFHHVRDKAGMLKAVFELLRPDGRFVIHNMCPHECRDWLYYEYFPEALTIDLEDFWSPETTIGEMTAAGFSAVTAEREHVYFEQDLRVWLGTVKRRDICSQLLAISDAVYQAGIRRLERELADSRGAVMKADHLCLVTFRGERRT
jgi:SAM-dependent methyltransferase